MPVYYGTLVNELDSGANLEALLMYDHDLFANMVLPTGLDKYRLFRLSAICMDSPRCTTPTPFI